MSGGIDGIADERTLPAHLQETILAAREYAEAARSPNTLKAYESDVRDFATYCRVELGGVSPLPAGPEAVALYLTDMAREEPMGRGLATSTIARRLASISAWHKRGVSPRRPRIGWCERRYRVFGARRAPGRRRPRPLRSGCSDASSPTSVVCKETV